MADKKITELTECAALETTDLIPVVDDPSGSAELKKATLATVISGISRTTVRDMASAVDTVLVTEQGIREAINSSANGWVAVTGVNDQAPSSSTITVTGDITATVTVGTALKFTLGGTATNPGTYYAICTGSTYGAPSTTLTIAGPPLETDDGDLTALYYNVRRDAVENLTFTFGRFDHAAGTSTTLAKFKWPKQACYIVRVEAIVGTADTGVASAATIQVQTDGAVHTALDLDGVLNNSVVTIDPDYYDLAAQADVTLVQVLGAEHDAENLTVTMTVVYP